MSPLQRPASAVLGTPAPGRRYTPEIDGLRALAVTGVVVEHAFGELLPGGFVGVDVFFVISGFLIGRILVGEFEAGRFSLAQFYRRRAARILPALLVVVLATTLMVLALYAPSDIAGYGQSVLSVAVFGSNFFFFSTSGYFWPSADLLPLLHTWSLAIEEQFYILFPLLVWLGVRLRRLRILLVVGGVASFALSWALVGRYPDATFYLLPTRAWELLMGACLAALPIGPLRGRWAAELLGVAGLALVLGSLWLLTPQSVFPGPAALPACLGAAMLIAAATLGRSRLLAAVLANAPARFVGAISYSLYLWHWPVLAMIRYAVEDTSPALLAAGIGVSFLLAVATWWFVERAFHRPSGAMQPASAHRPRAMLLRGSAAALTVLAAVGVTLTQLTSPSFAQRVFGPTIARVAEETALHTVPEACSEFVQGPRPERACLVGDPAKPTSIALWGDSYAGALVPGLASVLKERSAHTFVLNSCPAILGARRVDQRPAFKDYGPKCAAFNAAVLRRLVEDTTIDTVVVFSSWSMVYDYPGEPVRLEPTALGASPEQRTALLIEALVATVQTLRDAGKRVVVVGAFLRGDQLGATWLARGLRRDPDAGVRLRVPAATFDAYSESVNARLRALEGEGIAFVDPRPLFCRAADVCDYVDGVPLLADGSHLSPHGARRHADAMAAVLERRGWPH